ncbi:LysE/ArgO family amino acid transporter [Neptuniibacter halophilus]|uniref:LysE/ArgO family amino acid transporter n=1 Tax=Neptuniibacter halophilus TaxID=651666 RepID=UPI002572A364|nr:LysE/ArgO family amino acid transporter [Neptuniibacter halophilus]
MLSLITAAQVGALLKGLATSAGLIVAIGAQNAFVLSQGLRRQYHWPVAGLCAFFDIVLISLGVAGMGLLVTQSPVLMEAARWGGALFLLWYGARSLRSAFRAQHLGAEGKMVGSLKAALLTTLAVTLLNPHAYLDTLVLLGSIGGQYPADERGWFAAGAIAFSCIWFFSLTLGARFLQPVFRQPRAWQVLDLVVCGMMWAIAATLLWPVIATPVA